MGAVSRSPGRLSRSTSPNAIRTPNATAMRGSRRPSTAVWATEATSTTPAATTSSSRPESLTCQGDRRSSYRRWVMGISEAVAHPERRTGIVVVLGGDGGQVVGGGHGRLRALPAVALDRGHESIHERAGAAVGPGGGHGVERVGHGQHPGELGDLVAGQAHRVATAVDPLVMMHDPGHGLIEEPDLPHDVQAAHRVQLDRLVLLL